MAQYNKEIQELEMISGMLSRCAASDCEEFLNAFADCCRGDDMEVIGRRAEVLAQELSDVGKKLAESADRIRESDR